MARGVTRVGAAAFALGMSLLATSAPAMADSPDDQPSPAAANPKSAAADAGRSGGRPARGQSADPTDAGTAARSPVPPTRAALRTRADDRGVSAGGTQTAPPAGAPSAAVTIAVPPVGAPQSVPAAPAASDTLAVAAGPVAAPVPATAPSIATAGVPAAAATTTTDTLTNPLAPVQSLIEGLVLLVRRTFFNQAPTVSPVQTTGQLTGPITGSVGAMDPEGDPITYTVTSNPAFGSVQIGPDGGYVYTPGSGFTGIDTFTVAAADSGFHINLLDPFRPARTLANVVVDQGRAARVQFDFAYAGGALLWSPEARSALESAATVLGSYFLVESPVTITYTVNGEFALLSGQLASATSDMISSRAGFFPTVVQQKIVAGVDVNGSDPDGTITWNFANPWALGSSVGSGEYDFRSVAMHELLHTFGFLSAVVQPGSNTDTTWTAFDGFLVTAGGDPLISSVGSDGSAYAWNSAHDADLTSGVYFGGPAAVAAFGRAVPLYTPNPWQAGSSVSHLNDSTFVGSNKKLMNARVSTGTGIRTLSRVETAILGDLGYTMATPSGASAVLMIGLVVFRRRRRGSRG